MITLQDIKHLDSIANAHKRHGDENNAKLLHEAAVILSKEIPAQVTDRDSFEYSGIRFKSARCPVCRTRYDEDDDRWLSKYCTICGQQLNWNEDANDG